MPRPSSDPVIQELVRRARSAQLSRRQLLRGSALGAAVLGTGALASCAGPSGPGDGSGGTLRWANWTYYLDYDEETGDWPSLNEFMKRTNISVEYFEDIDDNKTFIAKIKDQLKLEQDTGYDVIVPSDTTTVRLVEQDQLLQFDRSLMPNVDANMIDMVKNASFDPDRVWSVPYQAGMTGLVYNTQLYPKGVREVSDLWAPELSGKVNLLTEQDDTLALIMLEQGVDIEGDWGDPEFEAALAVAKQQIDSGQVATVKGNSYTQDLEQGTVWAGMCWSGDIAILNEEAGEEIWKFVVPESGASVFVDSFSMPKATQAFDQVHELVDYYYEPEVAAQVAEYVQYVCPVAGAQEAMAKLNPELAENPLIFPDADLSGRIFDMRSLTAEEDNRYTQAFQKVLGN
ncbi:ABC transporter substrate-binding protein [Leucobacter luti]|uniref:Spermidine/putrescine transport system substrate-binding protein n=1 Tax=Leucobacter luti TaxID=340320 RepID=A0A4Q7TY16_9MICO|nr:spermidine/putrescine ABC transporter substrate-binding protein [Leucobacter luti]MBL3698549.1 extracellular solute-binding protein [Leucobacter luti]RZT65923.1 spermidine/putrescine transport system substrate-binding protein [Leucobacter luti]